MAATNDIDYLKDANGDLIIESGDFKKGDASLQHMRDILIAAPGHYRQFPIIGADITQLINGELDVSTKKQIIRHLSLDGYNVKKIDIVNDNLEINAVR